MWRLLADTFLAFWKHECPRLAAALAFYTVFSLPALLTFTVLIAATFASREAVTNRLSSHLEEAMGEDTAKQVTALLAQAQQPGRGLWATLMGLVVLVLGATGAMQELQTALNRVWAVQPDPQQGGRWAFLWKRLTSLAMLMGIAGLLLASLVASWAISYFGDWISARSPEWLSTNLIWVLNVLLSLGMITTLAAVIMKYMPDARLRWSDVWAGAIVTALLFVAGKIALGVYFAQAKPASAYGVAGSLALVLLWIYYSAQVLLLGAEFTHAWAERRGRRVRPEQGARSAPAPADGSQHPA